MYQVEEVGQPSKRIDLLQLSTVQHSHKHHNQISLMRQGNWPLYLQLQLTQIIPTRLVSAIKIYKLFVVRTFLLTSFFLFSDSNESEEESEAQTHLNSLLNRANREGKKVGKKKLRKLEEKAERRAAHEVCLLFFLSIMHSD